MFRLTTIGGGPLTNKLMSLTNEYKWMEKFPPMPTRRMLSTTVCTGTVLIIAGGAGQRFKSLATVKVLKHTQQLCDVCIANKLLEFSES